MSRGNSVYVKLSDKEKKALKEMLDKYGFRSEAEFLRYIIRELYTKKKIDISPIDTLPLEEE